MLGKLQLDAAGAHRFSELIGEARRLPQCFAIKGTFLEIAAFLEGFAGALALADPKLPSEWQGFKDWLPGKLRYYPDQFWSSALWERYPEDGAALEQLWLLYQEYVETRRAEVLDSGSDVGCG